MEWLEDTTLKIGSLAGIDEVGRGALAGNVVAAIVHISPKEKRIEGVYDSKQLTSKKREYLAEKIKEVAEYHICEVGAEEIDRINILNATKLAMLECINKMNSKIFYYLVDGNFRLDTELPHEPIVKGDTKSYHIACASILAKVYRDKQMEEYAKIYPQYHFEKHKGYGTKLHFESIKKYGLCEIHRKTFTKKILDSLEKIEQ